MSFLSYIAKFQFNAVLTELAQISVKFKFLHYFSTRFENLLQNIDECFDITVLCV